MSVKSLLPCNQNIFTDSGGQGVGIFRGGWGVALFCLPHYSSGEFNDNLIINSCIATNIFKLGQIMSQKSFWLCNFCDLHLDQSNQLE